MTAPTFQILPLSAIVASPTNPRQVFDIAALEELANSIRASGVHQPVLVRPLPASRLEDTAHKNPRPTHELVAGERRLRASVIAGAATIPAMVRDLSDDQVLEIQIVENLQRQDLTALEEAQGYEVLMQHTGLSAEDVADKIGKSRTYVFGRLKLMALGQDGRQALRDGLIDASKALLLARIPDTTLQVKALKEILRPNHPEGVMSTRMAGDWIKDRYMLKLEKAVFSITDASLTPGPCTGCLSRTGAAPDIFADVKGADVCTDPGCYDRKVQQHRAKVRGQLEASGHTVIDEREAKEIMPYAMSAVVGYARLDDTRDSPTDQTLREELAELIDSGEVKPVMVANPHKEGELIACVPEDAVHRLLTKAGRKAAVKAADEANQAQYARQAEKHERELRDEFERAWRRRLVLQLKDELLADSGCKLPPKVLRIFAERQLENLTGAQEKALAEMLNLGDVAPEEGLRQWLRTVALGNDREWILSDALLLIAAHDDSNWNTYTHNEDQTAENNFMLAAADDLGIDIEAVKSQVQAEMTEREAQKAADAQALANAAAAPLPLAPAAQANGVRGEAKGPKGKGKKAPAGAGAQRAHLNAQEAMQGIAAALQGDEAPDAARRSEAIPGADAQSDEVGPAARPDGAASTGAGAQADADGAAPALASQAAAVGEGDGPQDEGVEAVRVGDRVKQMGAPFPKTGTVTAVLSDGDVVVDLDGAPFPEVLEAGEYEVVAKIDQPGRQRWDHGVDTGMRIHITGPHFTDRLATVVGVTAHARVTVFIDGLENEYCFEQDEYEVVEGGAA